MAILFARGGVDEVISDADLSRHLHDTLQQIGDKQKVLALPPDFTRANSKAGELTVACEDYYGDKLVDIMPALGTHVPMPEWQLDRMFPGVPKDKFRDHDWRNDVVTAGENPSILRQRGH